MTVLSSTLSECELGAFVQMQSKDAQGSMEKAARLSPCGLDIEASDAPRQAGASTPVASNRHQKLWRTPTSPPVDFWPPFGPANVADEFSANCAVPLFFR